VDNQKFIEKCKDILISKGVKRESIFVVWSCKTLQNNKAILSYAEKGAPLYEMTHNGDKNEIYVDTYLKKSNECIKV
jgi:hypothetical protein